MTWWEVNVTRSVGRYIFLDVTQASIFWQLFALALLVFAAGWWIGRSRLGLALRNIGDDEVVARHCGIDRARETASVRRERRFMTLAGAVMAPRWTYIDPSIAFNPAISFQALIMALLGGARRLWGPVLGVVPLTLLFEVLGAPSPTRSRSCSASSSC